MGSSPWFLRLQRRFTGHCIVSRQMRRWCVSLFPKMKSTSSNRLTTIYRSLSFQQKPTDNHASKGSSWANEIGVLWIGRNWRGNLFLILGLRKKKAMVKLSGRVLTYSCSVLLLICILNYVDILWLYHVLDGSLWFYLKRRSYEPLRFRRSANQEWSSQKTLPEQLRCLILRFHPFNI